jgi:parallel beta-helix repeat protein
MKLGRYCAGALLCVLFVFASQREVNAQGAQEPQNVRCQPDLIGTNSGAINDCLRLATGLSKGSHLTISLSLEIYTGNTQINCANNPGVHVTIEGPGSGKHAIILATPDLGNQNLFRSTCTNLTVRYVWFHGNKLKRDYKILIKGWEDNKEAYHYLCDADGWRPANMIIKGDDSLLEDVKSTHAACGTGIGVSAWRVRIIRATVEFNGFEAPKWVKNELNEDVLTPSPGRSHQMSDGITFEFCGDCVIADSVIANNTDLGIVLGGGPRNRIINNTCTQDVVYAFGCINVGRFDTGRGWDGRHDDLIIEYNIIRVGYNMATFGISVGGHLFVSKQSNKHVIIHTGGTLRKNNIDGAMILIAIEGVENLVREDNILGKAQGSQSWFNHCLAVEKTIVGHVKSGVKSLPGDRKLFIDGGDCSETP